MPKPAPRRTPPSAPSASDRENYNSDSRGQKKASIEEKRKDGGESCTSSSSTGSASVDSAGIHSTGAGAGGTGSASAGSTTTGSASKPSPSPREGGETQEAVHGGGGGGGGGGSGEEGKNDAEGDAVEVESCAVGDNDGGGSEDVKPSDVDGIGKVDVAVGDEEERDACGSSPEQPENRDNGARERGEGKSTPSADKVETPRGEEQTPGGTGEEEEPKEEQGPMHEEAELRRADATVKVPHVVTRVRSRSLRVEQTYTGLLEGAALEVG